MVPCLLAPAHTQNGRRRVDGRHILTIQYPCPRCTAADVLVTHRGVMMTTLFCTTCHHAWGEPPAVIAAATQGDRRALARAESAERRNPDRLPLPTCTYCATSAYVRSIRRTADAGVLRLRWMRGDVDCAAVAVISVACPPIL